MKIKKSINQNKNTYINPTYHHFSNIPFPLNPSKLNIHSFPHPIQRTYPSSFTIEFATHLHCSQHGQPCQSADNTTERKPAGLSSPIPNRISREAAGPPATHPPRPAALGPPRPHSSRKKKAVAAGPRTLHALGSVRARVIQLSVN